MVASGFAEYEPKPGEYAFGRAGDRDPRRIRAPAAGRRGAGCVHDGREVKKIAFIYCVGSRQGAEIGERQPLVLALLLQHRHPPVACWRRRSFPHSAQLPFLPRHAHLRQVRVALRGGGQSRARSSCASTRTEPPRVEREGDALAGHGEGPAHRRRGDRRAPPTWSCWSTGMTARPNDELTTALKLPLGADRFYNEIHPKLRPGGDGHRRRLHRRHAARGRRTPARASSPRCRPWPRRRRCWSRATSICSRSSPTSERPLRLVRQMRSRLPLFGHRKDTVRRQGGGAGGRRPVQGLRRLPARLPAGRHPAQGLHRRTDRGHDRRPGPGGRP